MSHYSEEFSFTIEHYFEYDIDTMFETKEGMVGRIMGYEFEHTTPEVYDPLYRYEILKSSVSWLRVGDQLTVYTGFLEEYVTNGEYTIVDSIIDVET